MLLCNIDEVEPGMVLGAAVVNPQSPDVELLKPGVSISAAVIKRLRSMGVMQLWVDDDITRDLDAAVASGLSGSRLAVYTQMRDDFARMSRQTITAGQVQQYRQSLMDMVCQLMSSKQYAGLTDQLFAAKGDHFSHGANVAYLALMAGLELENYIIRERPRLSRQYAGDLVNLGVGGMLHDIGKSVLSEAVRDHHEVAAGADEAWPVNYDTHTIVGFRLLRESRAPASATQAVLNHHQRYDGTGWPDLSQVVGDRLNGNVRGRNIHVFTRIVAAANVLDNLLRDAEGNQRPPVIALHEFASPRFEGWLDPVVRQTMLRVIPPYGIGTRVGLSDGRSAVVVAPNRDAPCRPLVRLLGEPTGSDGQPAALDLAQCPELRITTYLGRNVEAYAYDVPPVPAEEAEAA